MFTFTALQGVRLVPFKKEALEQVPEGTMGHLELLQPPAPLQLRLRRQLPHQVSHFTKILSVSIKFTLFELHWTISALA